MNLEKLKNHLSSCALEFIGKEWIDGRTKYDSEFAKAINGNVETNKEKSRYWDCSWNSYFIELKLGKTGAWFNLVRYSEIFLEKHPHKNEVVTLCVRYSRERNSPVGDISTIYFLETNKLIEKLGLGKAESKQLLKIKEDCPRDFNAQASLTYRDISEIATDYLNINIQK